MTGRIFAIVGPSGAGKDTLMAAARARRPSLHLARRVITRPETAGGEPFEGVTEAEFARRVANGAFALHWGAHGLRYGIPADALDTRADVLFNASRSALAEAARVFPGLVVLNVTASPEVLAQRLAARGRETPAQIAARLARADRPLPPGLRVIEIDNSGRIEEATDALLAALDNEREEV